jgi:DNA-binding response OmpR family regulator
MSFSNCNYQILYAEDNEDSRELVRIMCQMAGIEVVTAETAAEAWELSQSKLFDLYLLDSRFPDGCGLDLCRRLRSFAPLAPILFYSGNAHEADRQKGLAAGASDYLTKPYMADLAATIRQNIEQTNKSALIAKENFVR